MLFHAFKLVNNFTKSCNSRQQSYNKVNFTFDSFIHNAESGNIPSYYNRNLELYIVKHVNPTKLMTWIAEINKYY